MARAKKTARADARRRYRAEQGLPDELSEAGAPEADRPTSPADRQPPAQRLSIGAAFRQSFTSPDVVGDLKALPWIAIHSKALWVPALITIVATAAFYITQGSDLLTRFGFAYFVQTPAIGGVFLAGFLAPRASWLLGVVIGLLAAACYSFLVLTVFAAVADASETAGLARDVILSAFLLSPTLGAVFAAAAAWYRRFLALSNPNRARREAQARAQNRPDGKSRSSQKATARR